MAKNPDFDAVLAQMETIHDAKNEDYASGGNPYSNFEGTAAITGQSVDKVFQTMIGIKMERLKQLVGTGKDPNYESIDDTILDLANYAAIWLSYRQRRAFEAMPINTEPADNGLRYAGQQAIVSPHDAPY